MGNSEVPPERVPEKELEKEVQPGNVVDSPQEQLSGVGELLERAEEEAAKVRLASMQGRQNLMEQVRLEQAA